MSAAQSLVRSICVFGSSAPRACQEHRTDGRSVGRLPVGTPHGICRTRRMGQRTSSPHPPRKGERPDARPHLYQLREHLPRRLIVGSCDRPDAIRPADLGEARKAQGWERVGPKRLAPAGSGVAGQPREPGAERAFPRFPRPRRNLRNVLRVWKWEAQWQALGGPWRRRAPVQRAYVADSLETDVLPARRAEMYGVWIARNKAASEVGVLGGIDPR